MFEVSFAPFTFIDTSAIMLSTSLSITNILLIQHLFALPSPPSPASEFLQGMKQEANLITRGFVL